LLKILKKQKVFFTDCGLNILTSETSSYTIDDLSKLTIKKITAKEQGIIREAYPMINIEEITEYLKKIINENSLSQKGIKNIEKHFEDFKNGKINALLSKGKTAENFNKIKLPDDFYERLSIIMLERNEASEVIYKIDEKHKEKIINWVNEKENLSYFKEMIIKKQFIPVLISNLNNDIRDDKEILTALMNDEWIQWERLSSLCIFLHRKTKEDKNNLKLFKEFFEGSLFKNQLIKESTEYLERNKPEEQHLQQDIDRLRDK